MKRAWLVLATLVLAGCGGSQTTRVGAEMILPPMAPQMKMQTQELFFMAHHLNPEALPALAWFEHAVDATVRQWRFEPASICTFPPEVERNEDCAGEGVVRKPVPLRLAFVFEFSRSERRGRFSTNAGR